MESLAKCSVQGSRPEFCLQPRTVHSKEARLRMKDVRSFFVRLSTQESKQSASGAKSLAPPLRLKQTATKAPSSELSISTQLRNQRMTERRLQLGRSVDALREYFPHLLVTPWPQELLSDEVVLKETISPHFGLKPFNAYGKRNYNRRMWFVRLYASLFCRETKVKRIIIVIGTGPYLMCCVGRLSGAGNAVLAAEQRDRHHSMEHEISPTRLSQHLRHDFADGWRFGDQTGSPRTYLSASGGCDRPTQSQV